MGQTGKFSRRSVRRNGSGRSIGSSATFLLLVFYVAAIPLKFQIRWLLVYVQLALFSVIVLRVVWGFDTIPFTRTQIVAFVILAVTVATTVLGHAFVEQGANLDRLPEVGRFLVLALGCALELDTRERLNRAFTTVMWAVAVVSLLSILNLFVSLPFAFTGQPRTLGPLSFGVPRSLGVWMSFGSFGVLAVIGISYAGMSALRPGLVHTAGRTERTQVLSTVALVLILLGVFLGQSRSTILSLFVVLAWALIVATFHPDTDIRAARPELSGGVLLAGVVGVSINFFAIIGSFVGANTASVFERFDQYRFALGLMVDRPLFGWGWGFFAEAFGTSYTVHNLWFLVGVSLGVPVFVLWIYMFSNLTLDIFKKSISADTSVQVYGVIGTAVALGGIIELALYPGFTPAAAVLLGLLLAIQGIERGWTPT